MQALKSAPKVPGMDDQGARTDHTLHIAMLCTYPCFAPSLTALAAAPYTVCFSCCHMSQATLFGAMDYADLELAKAAARSKAAKKNERRKAKKDAVSGVTAGLATTRCSSTSATFGKKVPACLVCQRKAATQIRTLAPPRD